MLMQRNCAWASLGDKTDKILLLILIEFGCLAKSLASASNFINWAQVRVLIPTDLRVCHEMPLQYSYQWQDVSCLCKMYYCHLLALMQLNLLSDDFHPQKSVSQFGCSKPVSVTFLNEIIIDDQLMSALYIETNTSIICVPLAHLNVHTESPFCNVLNLWPVKELSSCE